MKTTTELQQMTAADLAAYYRALSAQAATLDACFGRQAVTGQLLDIESLYADQTGTDYPTACQQLAA